MVHVLPYYAVPLKQINKFICLLIYGICAGPYPEQISYWLTSMDAKKNVPKKQKVKLLTLTLFVCKKEA